MRTSGLFLLAMGAGSFIFRQFGYRPMIMSAFGEYEKVAAGIMIGVGALLFGLSWRKKKDATT